LRSGRIFRSQPTLNMATVAKNGLNEYVRILKELFSPTKNPSRHLNEDVETLFQRRKCKLQSILSQKKSYLENTTFIHIAGTKGKGSTCEYIASGLRELGYKVGVFTSPHLHTARERIKINRSLIGYDASSPSDFLFVQDLSFTVVNLLGFSIIGGLGISRIIWRELGSFLRLLSCHGHQATK